MEGCCFSGTGTKVVHFCILEMSNDAFIVNHVVSLWDVQPEKREEKYVMTKNITKH